MATKQSEQERLRAKFSGMPASSNESRALDPFPVICMLVRWQLTPLMQAALVRDVAFNMFAHHPLGFGGHPSSSLTWQALDALEGSCIVQVVEHLRGKLVAPHVPPVVNEKLEKLVGHRHRVSHPSNQSEEDWRDPKMQRFEAEGRRYESCVPLAWDLQQAINVALAEFPGADPIPDFYVTLEMARELRLIYQTTLNEVSVPHIPPEETHLEQLHEYRRITLQRCQDRANGMPPPPKRDTELDRLWAEKMREWDMPGAPDPSSEDD